MQKRAYFLQICFAIFSFILLGKLAYEELYRSALLTGTLNPQSDWSIWLQQLIQRF